MIVKPMTVHSNQPLVCCFLLCRTRYCYCNSVFPGLM